MYKTNRKKQYNYEYYTRKDSKKQVGNNNDDVLRECESNYLDPDFDNNIYTSSWGADAINLVTCELCGERYCENEILRAAGIDICMYCAEDIVDAWTKRNGG